MNAKRWLLLLSVMLLGCGEPTAPVDVKVTVTDIPPGTTALKVTARLGEKSEDVKFSATELGLDPTSTSHQSATFTLRLRSGGEGTVDVKVAAMLDDCEMSINQQASQISLDPMLSRQGTVMLARKRHTVTIMKPASTTIDGSMPCTAESTCSLYNINACSKISVKSSDPWCPKLEYKGACQGYKCEELFVDGDKLVAIEPSPSLCHLWPKTDRTFRAVWMRSATDIWVVGNNILLNYNGKNWIFKPESENLDLHGIWGVGDDMKYVGITNEHHLYSVHWVPGEIARAVGGCGLKDACIYKQNKNKWELEYSILSSSLQAIWAASADEIWAVGSTTRTDEQNMTHHNSAILRGKKSGSNWTWTTVSYSPEDSKDNKPLRGVWGFNNNVWAVGEKGLVLHWDGSSWSREGHFSGLNLNSVWGQGTDLWVVGDGGIVLHRSANWQSSFPTTKNLNGVFGIGKDVWVVGDGGTVLHYVNYVLQPNPM